MEDNARTVVVTGASAGVGRAIAKAFGAKGYRVGLIARSAAALNQVKTEVEAAGGKALVLPCDVSESEALEKAATDVEEQFGSIDIWVNNAMATVFSQIKNITPEEFRRVTDVTYHGSVYGTMAALKRMLPRQQGHIIQIGSALAYRSIPLQSAYCGAKHALHGFTDSLRAELIHQKIPIDVSMVQLSAFNTPQFIWARNHTGHKAQPLPPIHAPALAAEAVLWTVDNPQREVWVGWPAWKAILGNKLLPGFLDRYVAKTAWEGQFAGEKAEEEQLGNLFQTIDHLHNEQGPFADREIEKRPHLWHVKNHNFWINGAAVALLFAVFLLGMVVGAN